MAGRGKCQTLSCPASTGSGLECIKSVSFQSNSPSAEVWFDHAVLNLPQFSPHYASLVQLNKERRVFNNLFSHRNDRSQLIIRHMARCWPLHNFMPWHTKACVETDPHEAMILRDWPAMRLGYAWQYLIHENAPTLQQQTASGRRFELQIQLQVRIRPHKFEKPCSVDAANACATVTSGSVWLSSLGGCMSENPNRDHITRLFALVKGALSPPPGRSRIISALAMGTLCHTIFAAAVLAMIGAMFFGLSLGLGRVPWPWAVFANAALLAQFPLGH